MISTFRQTTLALFNHPFSKTFFVALIYFSFALLCIKISNQGTIATLWVPNALLLCLILRKYPLTHHYLLAGFIGSLCANVLTSTSIFISTGFALSNTIEVATVIIFYYIYQYIKPATFKEISQNYFFLALAIIFSCIVSAIISGIVLYLAGNTRYLEIACLWFAVDFIAMLAIVPLGLSVSQTKLNELINVKRLSYLIAMLIVTFSATLLSIFYLPSLFIVIALTLIFSSFFLNFFELSVLCFFEIIFIMQHTHYLILPYGNINNEMNTVYCYLLISLAVIPALLINALSRMHLKLHYPSSFAKTSLEHKLQYQDAHDKLTGIFNRIEFEKKLQQLIYQDHSQDTTHTLCYLDVDRFKIVNDSAGYGAGDALLIRIVELLKNNLNQKDILARIGGDEFAIILIDTPTLLATNIAKNLITALRDLRFIWGNKVYQVGLSIGLVSFKPAIATIEDVMSQADIACYTAKFRGGNNYAVYTEIDSEAAKHHAEIQIVSGMREALETQRLCLHAHAIEPLTQGNLKPFYELLVRLIDPHGKLINPAQFIPTAERFNLMADIDEWVIKKVLFELGHEIAAIPDFTFSINLSANSINAPYFLEFLLNALDRTPIPTERIGFELTETAIISYLEKAVIFIQALQNRGCFIALDDFGSGLSSFNYLKHFPVKYVKIDGSFIRMLSESPVDRAIVESINDLAHKLNAYTIAEYVETAEIVTILKQIKVDYAQGHAISKSIPLLDLLPHHINN